MPKVSVKCANPNCKGKGFVEVYPYRLKTTKNFFCCPECQAEFNSKPKKPQIAVKCDLDGCENIMYMTETEFKSSKTHFCCKAHHDEYKKNRVKLICDYCHEEYEVPFNRSLRKQEHNFCCKKHHDLFMMNRIKTICDYCGDEFEMTPSDYNRSKRHFCCPEHAKLGLKTNRYELFDDYAELIITSKTHGEKRVKIDLEDVEKCKELTWIVSYNKKLKSWYIQNNTWIDGVCKTTLLHRYLMNPPQDMEVDHQDRNVFNARKSNLKIVTRAENVENRGVTRRSTTGYLHVFREKRGTYRVCIRKNGVNHYKGCFTDIEEANKYAIELRNKLMTNNVFDRLQNNEDSQGA